jgi:hypothetical protein
MTPVTRMTAAIALLGGLLATPVLAQMQPRDPNMPDPKNVPAEKMAPDIGTTGSTGSGGTLSDKLERSEGVIKPPAIGDTEAVVPPPSMPDMPVIRPPGTSPADPVQPK